MRITIPLAVLIALAPARLAAQAHSHAPNPAERLGNVHFATSCSASVAPQFDRAVALLHSFEFGASIRAFDAVLASDSTCAMAHWGIALSRWGNPMSATGRAPAVLEQGRRIATVAARLAASSTERERGYASAVGQLYANYERADQPTRAVAYARAMGELVAKQPADTEAKIFYAIALVAAAPPTDKTYANQIKAGDLLEALWMKQPNHPGLAHYIIHAYDVPPLAGRAKKAAQRYAGIAPSAAHALHMPSHTFTRVGMWRESIATNVRSMDVATRDSAIGEALHASDYATYAYLQRRQDSAAKAIVVSLPALAARLDLNSVRGAAPPSAGIFAMAAIPARFALERRAWAEAAALQPKASGFPYTEAMTYFARALGAAQLRDTASARASTDSLAAIRDRLRTNGEPYWAEQVAIQQLGAAAWLTLAERRNADALTSLREAVRREDATEKAAVTPGPLVPMRELLGDMLLEIGQPAQALKEYEQSLIKDPNRFRTLDGARKAAAAMGDRAKQKQFAAALERLTGTSAVRKR